MCIIHIIIILHRADGLDKEQIPTIGPHFKYTMPLSLCLGKKKKQPSHQQHRTDLIFKITHWLTEVAVRSKAFECL